MTTVGDPFECPLSNFHRWQVFHDLGLPCLQRLAALPHLGDVH